MSKYDYLYHIKCKAKAVARSTSTSLAVVQNQLAISGGFQHFHELRNVAKATPKDIRLMRIALGTDDLFEVIYEDPTYGELGLLLDEVMSDSIAETNADGFGLEELEVTSARYDESKGIATLETEITYAGDQDPNKPFLGSSFYINAFISLTRRNSSWSLAIDALDVVSSVTDQELDWQQRA